jgi:membrane protease subunit (stomatin/prohibitin family)
LQTAVEEVKAQFKQCKRCGKWICPEVCFNEKRGLCMDCAPDVENELASAQATATKSQIWDKTASMDMTASVDLQAEAVAACPQCGAKTQGSKFCPECGANLHPKAKCGKCGHESEAGTKFCPECGNRLAA